MAELLVPYCVAEGIPADSSEGRRTLEAVTPLLVERMKRLTEAPPMVRFLFTDVTPDDKAAKALEGQGEYVFRQLAQYTSGRFNFLTYGADGVSPGDRTTHHVDDYSVLSLDELVVQLVRDELDPLDG